MSKNIYKAGWVVVEQEDKCVIDSNNRLVSRIEEWEEKKKHAAQIANGDLTQEDGFTSGLVGEQIDALLQDDAESGNIIKAPEEAEDVPNLEEIRAMAEAEIEEARRQALEIKKQALDEAQAQKQQILEEAKQSGYNEGMERAMAEADNMRQELEEKRRQLEAEYDRKIEELEPQFIDTITGVYNHIFQVELQEEREILVHLIETTLRKVESSRIFIVRVSKEDYPIVSAKKEELTQKAINGRGMLEIVEDVTLRQNECMIETDGGIFDCGVGTQLENLTKKLKVLSFEASR